MKLNICCGIKPKEGYVNVDVRELPTVDQVVDLNQIPWPWENDSIDEIYVADGLEHLYPLGKAEGQANIPAIMKEIWRVLKPGGLLEVMVPSTEGPGAWQDPTHVTYWNRNTFLYFLLYSPYQVFLSYDYPLFTLNERDLGIADTDVDAYGVVWTAARIRKVTPEMVEEMEKQDPPDGLGAPEGMDG